MKKVLYISLVDWFWIKQRPQQICEKLSNLGYAIDYFCIRTWKNKNKVQQHSLDDNINLNEIQVTNQLRIFRNHVIPKGKYIPINNLNGLYLQMKINKLAENNSYDYIVITHPTQVLYLSKHVRQTVKIVYDCMDSYKDFAMSRRNKKRIMKLEQKIVDIASCIIVSSEQIKHNLMSIYHIHTDTIKIINNGVDISNFSLSRLAQAENNSLLENGSEGGRKITYIGTISSWVDIELIVDAANLFKRDTFYLIGPIDIQLPAKLPINVDFLGSKRYELIPFYIDASDILLMPFKLNDVVKSVNPVKLYEYLAMGKDIIATRYSETLKFSSVVHLYSSKEEFYNYVATLGMRETQKNVQKRVDFAKKNSWQNRAIDFAKILNEQ